MRVEKEGRTEAVALYFRILLYALFLYLSFNLLIFVFRPFFIIFRYFFKLSEI